MRRLRTLRKWTGITLGILFVLGATLFARFRWRQRTTEDCPVLAWLHPIPHAPIQPSDWLQVRGAGGLPPHGETIRIYGDGHIDRDTIMELGDGFALGCPLHPEDKHPRVSAQQAVSLIAKARDRGFCRLCSIYKFPDEVFDAGTAELSLSVGGSTHTVWNHAGNPPPLFRDLIDAIYSSTPPLPEYTDWKKASPERKTECDRFQHDQVEKEEKRHPSQ